MLWYHVGLMARRRTARGAPHRVGLVLCSLTLVGCLYDWTVPDAANEGGAPTTSSATTGTGGAGGADAEGGGIATGGDAAEGGGDVGGAAPGGGMPTCSAEPTCADCKACVYDELAGTGTVQECALYVGCGVACGADALCQGQCMNMFPGGYAIQLELLQSCDAQCPGIPSCI